MKQTDRRSILRLAVAGGAAAAIPALAFGQGKSVAPGGVRLTLLGTAGGPPPHPDRSQPASLLQVGGKNYLIDAGENVAQQSLRVGVPPQRIDAAFITHLHWDHVLGLGYLMATGWMMNRTAPMPVWGPPGIAEYVRRETSSLGIGEDIFRVQATNRPALASLYPVREIDLTKATEIYRDDVVRVTAAPTMHYGAVPPPPHAYGVDKAYAYRFDSAKGSVTFTGDTGPSETVAALAKGSDILVSEICDVDSITTAMVAAGTPAANLQSLVTHMRDEHLTPEAVGKLASAAGVRKLVLSHYVMGRGVDPASLVTQVRDFYSGEIVAGRDLLAIDL